MDNIFQCLKDNGYGELPEELGQEALDNYFDMRQGKAESILDYIFREEILTVALKNDTAIDLDRVSAAKTTCVTTVLIATIETAITQGSTTTTTAPRTQTTDETRCTKTRTST